MDIFFASSEEFVGVSLTIRDRVRPNSGGILVSLLRIDAVAIVCVCCCELWTLWATRLRCPHVHSLSAAAPIFFEEAMEFATGRVEGTLLLLGRAVGDQRFNAGPAWARRRARGWVDVRPAVEERMRELRAEGMDILKIGRTVGVDTSVLQRIISAAVA